MGTGIYGQYAPTAQPTPFGATPAPVNEEIQIAALNLRFSPTQITVKPGETVRFVVTNNDPFLHHFVSPEAGIPFLNLPGHTTQSVTWTALKTVDTYTAVCTLHPGMSLTVVVVEPAKWRIPEQAKCLSRSSGEFCRVCLKHAKE